jgi:hypothetical protein
MKIDKFINTVDECCNDVEFSFHGKPAGITPEVEDGVKTFHVWHGENMKDYLNVQDVMDDKFFDGQSMRDIFDNVEIWFS